MLVLVRLCARMCCGDKVGIYSKVLRTSVYHGAVCWLPRVHVLRAQWKGQHRMSSLQADATPPAVRSNERQRFDAASVLDGAVDAVDAGTYGLGVLADRLPHLNLYNLHHVDPMHLKANAGYPFGLLLLLTLPSSSLINLLCSSWTVVMH